MRRNWLSFMSTMFFCLHGLSREFITDRDTRFTSAFWQEVTVLLGTRTVMSFPFHPQTDDQMETVNQILETYLRHFVSVGLNDWDTLLSRAEFAHNAAVNETVRATPFKLTCGYNPRTPVGEVVRSCTQRLLLSLSACNLLLALHANVWLRLNKDKKPLQTSVV
jgi:transposase InsO family protein